MTTLLHLWLIIVYNELCIEWYFKNCFVNVHLNVKFCLVSTVHAQTHNLYLFMFVSVSQNEDNNTVALSGNNVSRGGPDSQSKRELPSSSQFLFQSTHKLSRVRVV